MPKVSIVLPTYNGRKYLRQSIESILSQTYTDWELILVDDCSTDETFDIIEKYVKSDPRIRAIHNSKNLKLPGALNVGFSVAKGKYLTWTSDDNLYMPDAIEVMAEFLDSHDTIYMVHGNVDLIDSEGKMIGELGPYDNKKMYALNCVGACFMYRKEVRDRIGNYNEDAFCVEDYEYWLRVLDGFGEIVSVNQKLYQYRIHEGSLSKVRQGEVINQLTRLRIRYIDKIFNVLQGNTIDLLGVYYEMRKSECMTQEIVERFKEVIPELRGEILFTKDRKYIIFGAGKVGEKAAEVLGSKAVFFADSDSRKAGKMKCGLKILYFEDAVRLANDYCILIAISFGHIYEMMVQLKGAGVKEYAVFPVWF